MRLHAGPVCRESEKHLHLYTGWKMVLLIVLPADKSFGQYFCHGRPAVLLH
jgi:hypothetical protein